MADEREAFAAFQVLSSTSRAFLATVEQAIGSGTSVKLSKRDFEARGISRGNSWLVAKTRLVQLGFIIVEAGGPNGCTTTANTYRLADDGWRDIGLAEARQLAKVARRRKPRTVWLMKQLAAAARNGNGEAAAVWRTMNVHKPVSIEDSYALARLKHERPDLFDKVKARGKPKQQPKRWDFADDAAIHRVFRIGRPGQRRASGLTPTTGARAVR
jgi:hypothetical protein